MPIITTADVATKLSEYVLDKLVELKNFPNDATLRDEAQALSLTLSHLLLGSGKLNDFDKVCLRGCVDANVITPAEYGFVTQDEYPVSQAPFATPELSEADLTTILLALAAVEVSGGGSTIHSLRLRLARPFGDDDPTNAEDVVNLQWQAARELYEGGASPEMLRRVINYINEFELPDNKLCLAHIIESNLENCEHDTSVRDNIREYAEDHIVRHTNDWSPFSVSSIDKR